MMQNHYVISSKTGFLLVSGEPGFPVPRFPVYRLQFTEWHGRSPPMTGISLTGKNCLSGNSVFVMLLLSGIFTCVPGKETLICFENSCVFNFPRLGDFPVQAVFPGYSFSQLRNQVPRSARFPVYELNSQVSSIPRLGRKSQLTSIPRLGIFSQVRHFSRLPRLDQFPRLGKFSPLRPKFPLRVGGQKHQTPIT